MQEGLAYVCLLTNGRTIVRGKIEMSIPRKHKGITSTVHEKVCASLPVVLAGRGADDWDGVAWIRVSASSTRRS